LNVLPVKDALTPSFPTLDPQCTLVDAVAQMERTGRGAHLVLDTDGRLLGICTMTDLQGALTQLRPLNTKVESIMNRELITLPASATLADAMYKFLDLPYKQLVVTADDDAKRPVGLITPFGILRVYVQTNH
jgi:signal-transduction protein with cAMP-binding, CBS, and nucleotidyltransferase domain